VKRDFIKDVLFGVSVGDAIGVPVEFQTRKSLQDDPVTSMRGYGSHHQPPGTWSDDSALTFCLAEMLCGKYDLDNLAQRFVNWEHHAYWTPHGSVFDEGIATSAAIHRLVAGVSPVQAGGNEEGSNGNGSLMRILPLLFFVKRFNIDKRFQITKDVSSLTHRHIRSVLACFIYLEIAMELLSGKEKRAAYQSACVTIRTFLDETASCTEEERAYFFRILPGAVFDLKEEDVHSGGYVIHTLEASIWCFLNTRNYAEAVLKAVNLGGDSDTTGAVTGGLAGLFYGWQTIPEEWLRMLVRKDDIEDLGRRLGKKLG